MSSSSNTHCCWLLLDSIQLHIHTCTCFVFTVPHRVGPFGRSCPWAVAASSRRRPLLRLKPRPARSLVTTDHVLMMMKRLAPSRFLPLGLHSTTSSTETESEKSFRRIELNYYNIKTHPTLYCIYFRLKEVIVGLHRIRSGKARAPPLNPSLYTYAVRTHLLPACDRVVGRSSTTTTTAALSADMRTFCETISFRETESPKQT